MPPKRTNSMIRGSGHSLQGTKKSAGSILRRSKKGPLKGTKQQDVVFDLILLDDVTENAVVENTKAMYYEDHIYSYIGNVVIAMNPFRPLPIYTEEYVRKYNGRSAFDPKLAPHIFALADNVFSDMKFRSRDQVVIISGESGAGKTESSKKIMQYVAAVSGNADRVEQIKKRLLNTNPVLEAFGNAKTTRNDNSSRFGKYMDIQFDYAGDPAGGLITTYLLEKARVVRQGAGERNFHVFYLLLASGEASGLGLTGGPDDYQYLRQGGSSQVKGINDKAWYKEMIDGLNYIGFSKEEQTSMLEVLASIIMLGDVTFKSAGEGAAIDQINGKLASLVGTSDANLEQGLTHNTVIVNKQQLTSDLSAEQASDSRDTLAKAMYERLFRWVYERINSHISADKAKVKAVIGVLDIYGFEIFKINSFEQFCINYCNEKLQQLFIELTLKSEQDEYIAEGIEWTPITYFNNKVICDLVESRPTGIVALLDEESIRPGDKSDKVWLQKMSKALASNERFVVAKGASDKSIPQDSFKLCHYAGDVVYSVHGFLEKNTDTLYRDLARVMFKSSNPVLKELFPEGDEATWAGVNKRPPTAGKAFVASMKQMIEILQTKIPSYVRCIKPNEKKAPKLIEESLLRHQVKYLGLVENVRVRRAGFCFRETYENFFQRYRILSDKTFPSFSGNPNSGCKEILTAMAIKSGAYQFGKTKVFIKNPVTVFALEEERDNKLEDICTIIQTAWRLFRIKREIHGYFAELRRLFANVKTDPNFGSKIRWPKHGKVLDESEKMLKAVWKNWWARQKVRSLSKDA